MLHEKGHYRRYASIGPGGWDCACCAPEPGPARAFFLRKVKKYEKQIWKRELLKELETISEERNSEL